MGNWETFEAFIPEIWDWNKKMRIERVSIY